MGKKRWKPQRQSTQEYTAADFDPAVVAEVESLFKKSFTYSAPTDDTWKLPPTEAWFPGTHFSDETLDNFKEDLNKVKSSLSDYDINQWHEHTSSTNRAGLVISYLRRHRKPELCTQAWCKFHEILHSYNIIPPPDNALILNSLHLCEAPGAFIASLNHYLQSKDYKCQWQWLANTLNPYYEGNSLDCMIDEDGFIHETLDRWIFGADNTGDIMVTGNLHSIQADTEPIQPVHLVTADGSIDCQNKPGEQEIETSSLHFAETVAALHILSPGGSFVLKTFTLFESCSISLLYLLNCAFQQVNVCKPATSKSGNSEVYVVCLNFRGLSLQQLKALSAGLGPKRCTLFEKGEIGESFLAQHRQCVQLFVKLQIQTIEENKQLREHTCPDRRQRLELTRHCGALSYLHRFSVRTIPQWQRLVPSHLLPQKSQLEKGKLVRSKHLGSYNDRQTEMSMTWQQRLDKMQPFPVNTAEPYICTYESLQTFTDEDIGHWSVLTGKPFERVQSSKFCDKSILRVVSTLQSHSQEHLCKGLPSIETLAAVMKEMGNRQDVSVMSVDEEKPADCIPVYVASSDCDSMLPSFLAMHLTEKVVFVCKKDRAEHEHVLVIPELYTGKLSPGTEEISLKSFLLTQLINILQVVEDGDHCVFPFYGCLTRFSTCLLFLLQAVFCKVTVLPSSTGEFPFFVFCMELRKRSPELVTYLQEVSGKFNDSCILQLLPVHYLLERTFHEFVMYMNQEVMKLHANFLLEKQIK